MVESLTELQQSLKYYLDSYPYGIPKIALERAKKNRVEISQAKKEFGFIFVVDYNLNNSEAQSNLAPFLEQIITKGLKLQIENYLIIFKDQFNPTQLPRCDKLVIVFGEDNFKKISPNKQFSTACNQVMDLTNYQVLISESLLNIKNNTSVKKEFWEVLKSYV